jgi:hypothetical protein
MSRMSGCAVLKKALRVGTHWQVAKALTYGIVAKAIRRKEEC